MNSTIKKLLTTNQISQKEYDVLFQDKNDFPSNQIDYFNQTLQKVITLQPVSQYALNLDYIIFINFELENFNLPKNIDFNYNLFYGKTDFSSENYKNNSQHKVSLQVYNCTFMGKLVFIDTDYDYMHFNEVEFYNSIHFSDTSFSDISITASYIHKSISFENFKFETLNLEGSHLPHSIFKNLSSSNKKELKDNNFYNKETLTIIKTSFEKQKNISESNRFFALEQDKYLYSLVFKDLNLEKLNTKIKKLQTILKNIWREKGTIFPLFLNKVISSHGTSWIKVLGWVLSFTILVYIFHEGLPNSKKELIQLPHKAVELIDPLKIFKDDYLYKSKEFWGYVVRIITLYLFWQFIVSFRQNTRRK